MANISKLSIKGTTYNISHSAKSLTVGTGLTAPDYSLVSGTADKTVITGVIGSTAASFITTTLPKSNAPCAISCGSGTLVNSTGGNAIGVMNTSGVKGYYYTGINFDTKQITLSTNRSSTVWSNVSSDWAVGDTISFVNNSKFPACAKITAINDNKSVITLDNLPFEAASDIVTYSALSSASYTPDDFTIFACYQKPEVTILGSVKNKRWYPRNGVIELGWAGSAFGVENLTTGSGSFTAGWNNWSAGDFSFTTGRDNIAGYASHVSGWGNTVSGDTSLASGRSNIVSGARSIVGGSTNTVTAANSFAIGSTNIVDSGNVIVGGYNNSITSSSSSSIVSGDSNSLSNAWDCAVFGNNNTVSGNHNLVSGNDNRVAAGRCVCGGTSNSISGNETNIFVFGNSLCATGKGAFATGLGSSSYEYGAFGAYSHHEGAQNKVGSWAGHVEGEFNEELLVNGKYSSSCIHIQGRNNKASGACTDVGGRWNTAAGNYIFMRGQGLISESPGQTVLGRYNKTSSDAVFIIGGGDGSGETVSLRKNALEVVSTDYSTTGLGNDLNLRAIPCAGDDVYVINVTPNDINLRSNDSFYIGQSAYNGGASSSIYSDATSCLGGGGIIMNTCGGVQILADGGVTALDVQGQIDCTKLKSDVDVECDTVVCRLININGNIIDGTIWSGEEGSY